MNRGRAERGGSPAWSVEALEPRLLLSADASPLEVLLPSPDSSVDSVISIDLVCDDAENPEARAAELSLTLESQSPAGESPQEQAQMESLSAIVAEVACLAAPETSLSSPLSQNDAGGEMPAESVAVSSVTEQLVETLHAANGPPAQDSLCTGALWIGASESLSGNVAVDGDVVLLGTLSPGNSPGIITVNGNLTFNSADPDTVGDGYTPPPGDTVGGLVIEIGGLGGPGDVDNGYDQVNVTGAVALGGTLQVVLINDFIPSAGATFDFLMFGSVSGQFSRITGPFDFGGSGLYFEVVQQADRLQLVATAIPADEDLHITTAATNRMEDALEGLANQADLLLSDLLLADPDLTGRTLPGTGVTLDELFGLSDYLDIGPTLDAYRAPMEELGSDVRFNIDEFLNYLRGSWLDDRIGGQAHDIDFANLIYMSSRYDWISGISLEFSGSDTYTTVVPVGLSQVVAGIGPAYTDREVTIDVDFAFTLSLGWDDSTGATYDFQVTRLELDASFDATDLVIPFMIGGLEAAAGHPRQTAGTMQFGAHLDLAYNEAQDEYQLTYDPVADAVSSLDLYLPIYAALAGVDVNQGPLATIDLSGDLFLTAEGGAGTAAVTAASANLGPFTPFANLTVADIRRNLESLRDQFLPRLAVSDQFNVEIPFVDASFADVLDLGAAFDLAVLRNLDFEGMDSLQDFVAEVEASGLLPAGQNVTYDPVSRTLRVPFEFEIDLATLTLRDLEALGVVNLELLEDEGLIQIGPYVDPDNLLDHGYADLADLAAAGVLDVDSVADWGTVNVDTVANAGIIGPAALAALGLIGPGNMVDLDDLIDEGLVTFGELAEADIITVGSIVANLGFIRDLNLAATNIADMAVDLTSQTSVANLVDLDGLLGSGIDTAANLLEDLFDSNLLNLGDINLDSLGISDIISQGIASLQGLVDQGLIGVQDFLSTTLIDISDLIAGTAVDLTGLLNEGLLDAADFLSSTVVDASAFFSHGVASLAEVVDADLAALDNFTNIVLPAAGLITDGLASAFELDYHDLVDGLGNVSLYDLVNSGVVTLEELIANGDVAFSNLLSGFTFTLSDLLQSGIANIAELTTATLVDVNDLATGYLDDLGALVNSGLVSLGGLVSGSLLDLADVGLDNLNIAALIESGLADLGDLARQNLIGPAQMAVDELLESEVTSVISGIPSSLIASGSIIDLDGLLADVDLPIKLHHLIYFGIIDHDDVRPLGTVDANVLTDAKVIDTSLLERYSLPELIALDYITIGDLVDLGELERADLNDLPVADLDAFGFSQAVIGSLDTAGYIVHGTGIALADLLDHTDVTMRDLLAAGLLGTSDLNDDLSLVSLDDLFVQGTVAAEDLLESDVLERAILETHVTQNAQGKDVVAVSYLTGLPYLTLADLVDSGLLAASDFNLAGVTVSESSLWPAAWSLPSSSRTITWFRPARLTSSTSKTSWP